MKTALALFTFFTASLASNAQPSEYGQQAKLVCAYRLTFRPDSTSANALIEKMELLVGDNFSVFRSALQRRDSMEASIKARSAAGTISQEELGPLITTLLQSPRRRFNYAIFKFAQAEKCVVYDDIAGEHYRYKEPAYPLTWQLASTTATILGYQCQQATTSFAGRRYAAWFTREIPLNDGPYKFSGLPGLIVSVQDVTKSYVFELISVARPTKPVKIDAPPTELVMTTTKYTFMEAAKATRTNAVEIAAHRGITFSDPEAVRAHVREQLKRANNPLELVSD